MTTTNNIPEDAQPCRICGTPVRYIPGVGVKHLMGYRERHGCVSPVLP